MSVCQTIDYLKKEDPQDTSFFKVFLSLFLQLSFARTLLEIGTKRGHLKRHVCLMMYDVDSQLLHHYGKCLLLRFGEMRTWARQGRIFQEEIANGNLLFATCLWTDFMLNILFDRRALLKSLPYSFFAEIKSERLRVEAKLLFFSTLVWEFCFEFLKRQMHSSLTQCMSPRLHFSHLIHSNAALTHVIRALMS